MVLTTKLLGSGKGADPYRVALPTYRLIFGNASKGTALVEIPEDVHGLTADDLKHETAEETTAGTHYPKLCKECVDKIHAHLDKTYAEHAGKFRLEEV